MTTGFDILPAIDLRGGRVVRLLQGDFDRETSYGVDPVAVARGFVSAGAGWLHVVDLDGARSGWPGQSGAIRDIIAAVGERAMVEVAGGLRDARAVDAQITAGAARVVIGTAVLRDPAFAARLVDRHGPSRVAVAIDVRDGVAVGQGWVPGATGVDPLEAIRRLSAVGITTFEVTAIDRDGTATGPDVQLCQRLVELEAGAIIASAGVSSVADLDSLRAVGCAGAIVGRALYDGSLDLAQALESSRPLTDRPAPAVSGRPRPPSGARR